MQSIYLGILFEASLILIAYVLGWILGVYPHSFLHFQWKDLGIGILASIPLVFFFKYFMRSTASNFTEIKKFLEEDAMPFLKTANWFSLVLLCSAAGLGEEFLFRGVLQSALSEKLGPLAGLWLSSFLFGLAHYITRSYALVAAGIGLYLGWLFNITGNLWASVVCHALYDFLAIQLFLRRKK